MVTVFDCMPNHGDCALTHNKLRYMHAADQEWILQLESSYLEIIYPPGLEHVDLTVICGELLQANAHKWELARHDGSNSYN